MPTYAVSIQLTLDPTAAELPKFLADSSTLYPADSLGHVTIDYGAAVAPALGLTLTDNGSVVLSYAELPTFLGALYADVPQDAFKSAAVNITAIPDAVPAPAPPQVPAPAPAA